MPRSEWCEECSRMVDDFTCEDGFFYCAACGTQSQARGQQTEVDEDDQVAAAMQSGVYNPILHRRAAASEAAECPPPDAAVGGAWSPEALPSLVAKENLKKTLKEEFSDPWEPSGGTGPRDFGAPPILNPEELMTAIRWRYICGLQVMLQSQCEVLVEKFGVSPIICGIVETVWLRYVESSKVFKEGWARKEVESITGRLSMKKVQAKLDNKKKRKGRKGSKLYDSFGRKLIYLFVREMRIDLPLYSTLVICFLSCHLAREAVLPTDFYKWVLDGALPYLNAFKDLDKHLVRPSTNFLVSTRFLFRPVRIISARRLESEAGAIAQSIGLRLPSVNFYGIALLYLRDLSLSVEKILPIACKIFEWSMPAELWISSNISRFPTRVCVMSILVVAIRCLYNINGQGIWEMSLLKRTNPSHTEIKGIQDQDNSGSTSSLTREEITCSSSIESEALIRALEDWFDKIGTSSDHSKDLPSFLKYCKDIVFSGNELDSSEMAFVEEFERFYKKSEDGAQCASAKSDLLDDKEEKTSNGLPTASLEDSEMPAEEDMPAKCSNNESLFGNDKKNATKAPLIDIMEREASCKCKCCTRLRHGISSLRSSALERLKFEMEENGFHYLQPIRSPEIGYVHYKRKKSGYSLVSVAHADYYILLRACARLAQVDIQTMHSSVLNLEKKLAWTENRIKSTLAALKKRKLPVQMQGGSMSNNHTAAL